MRNALLPGRLVWEISGFDQVVFTYLVQDNFTFCYEAGADSYLDVQVMKARSKSSYQSMQVVLGSQTIKAFVAAPKEFKVIGIVRMGLEFGLLAVTATGRYVRVNGSAIEALDHDAVGDETASR